MSDNDRSFPQTQEELDELRQRVRAEHAAYMRKWAGWKPNQPDQRSGP